MARDRTAQTLKARGLYFYDTPFSHIDGNSGTLPDEAGDERRMIMLSSFSYLGLIGHPEVDQASIDTIRDFGTGAHGGRLLTGNTTRLPKMAEHSRKDQ